MAGKKKNTSARAGRWYRRIVPPGYEEATLTLVGISPLLMSCADYDRESETYRAYFHLGKKSGKSLDDEQTMRKLEWTLRIYLDDEIGPFIPGTSIKRMLADAATRWRKGATLLRELVVVDYRVPLEYEGPRDAGALWKQGYEYTTMVKNAGPSGGRVMRCRPKFDEWALTVALAYNPEEIDFDTLGLIVERSRKYGLGDYRPACGGDFGCFDAALDRGTLSKAEAAGEAAKLRDRVDEQAHEASRDRIMAE